MARYVEVPQKIRIGRQIAMNTVFKTMYGANRSIANDGMQMVKLGYCRQTNSDVAVSVEVLPAGCDLEVARTECFTHPLLTAYVEALVFPTIDLRFTVSAIPDGMEIYDFLRQHGNNDVVKIRKSVHFVMTKMLTLLKDLEDQGYGLRSLQSAFKAVVLMVENGTITDMKVIYSFVCRGANCKDAKANLRAVAAMFSPNYWFAASKMLPLTEEFDFFNDCKVESDVTLEQLMASPYITTDPGTWVLPKRDLDTISVHTAYDSDEDVLASDSDDDEPDDQTRERRQRMIADLNRRKTRDALP